MKQFSILCLGVAAAVGLAARAEALPITGHVGFSGGATYDVQGACCPVAPVGLATIDFWDVDGNTPDIDGQGGVLSVAGHDGYFLLLNAGSTAVIRDLTNNPASNPPDMLAVPGTEYGPAGLANFLAAFTDADLLGLHFDLTKVLVAEGTECTGNEGVGASCVEGAFRLTDSTNGLTTHFDVNGYFRRGADEGYYQGSFDITLVGMHFPELFNRLDNTGLDLRCGVGNITTSCTMSANFDPISAVPEPATLLTFGVGALLLTGTGLRRRKKQ